MIKKFLIFLFVFGLFLKISPEVLAEINVPRVVTTPIILPNETPTPTPTSAPIIKPRVVAAIVLPLSATASPIVTPEEEIEEEILTSPTPLPTPTPEVSLPPTSLPSTNVWQLTTIGLAAAIVGGLIVALALRSGSKGK
jgi:MFS superfamily sulfate permease-like transporter